MRPFSYTRATDLAQAVQLGLQTGQGQTDAPVQFLAGGTTLYDLMKLVRLDFKMPPGGLE